jgi:hypothetical protein
MAAKAHLELLPPVGAVVLKPPSRLIRADRVITTVVLRTQECRPTSPSWRHNRWKMRRFPLQGKHHFSD